ncbi:MAG: hypothetical protein A3H35_19450 [Betaproteobacteria bacterium RIFCSPLOWO2_02_FULL_62_17]|nr:MAG: hypothetical protein A3H35_19450 [Betaproteobacteria bacterium RIFCSPLOWO2_02_FULL_62_17]
MTNLEQATIAKAQYDARWQRIMDCVALKQPDRMPTIFYATFWLAKYGGITYKELMYDYEKSLEISKKAVLEFEPDAASNLVARTAMGRSMEAIGLKTLKWPGHGVGEHQPYQYIDREYMKSEEYEEFLFDPSDYCLRKFLPQVAEAFEGFAHLPALPTLSGLRAINIRAFAKPEVRASLLQLMAAAEEVEQMAGYGAKFANDICALGYPLITDTFAGNPYDTIADYWRGGISTMKDLFRHKEKLMASVDKVGGYMRDQMIATAKASGNPIVMITTHWHADAFMSPKQFEMFYWPPFKKQLMAFIDAGLIPMVLWEHDCTKRMETIADVPAGKCIYWFERTENIPKAQKIMGDTVAFRGGVEASTMVTGKPEDVDLAVKSIVEKVWAKGGNLMLDCGIGIPDETPVENVRAMFDAARKYAG